MIKIDKTYIIHFEGLKDRKSYIDNEIINKQKVGFNNFEYIKYFKDFLSIHPGVCWEFAFSSSVL